MRHRLFLILSLAAVTISGGSARAGLVTYSFAGRLDVVNTIAASLPSDVHAGASFTGTLVYDDSVAPNFNIGTSKAYNALVSYSIKIGSATFDAATTESIYSGGSNSYVQLFNDHPGTPGMFRDGFILSAGSYDYSNSSQQRNAAVNFNLNEISANPTALSSANLAGTVLDLSKFTTDHFIQFADTNINNSTGTYNSLRFFQGTITSLTLGATAVPEPSTLLSIGLAGILSPVLLRRRMARGK